MRRLLLTTTLIAGCVTDSPVSGSQTDGPETGSSIGVSTLPGENESGTSAASASASGSNGSTGQNSPTTGSEGPDPLCQAGGESCGDDDECCSDVCFAGICLALGACEAPGTACDATSHECCSGSCQPVLGSQGEVACTNFCLADGQPCSMALDCCSLACNDGVCGGEMCNQESDACTQDSDCCSHNCNLEDNECEVDLGPGCRPIGESCTSGGSTECCTKVCDDDTGLCDFGPDVCNGPGAGCESDADCCNGSCIDDGSGGLHCLSPCTPVEGPCESNADCCALNCVDGSCEPPDEECTPTGGTCTDHEDCCSTACVGGLCELILPG